MKNKYTPEEEQQFDNYILDEFYPAFVSLWSLASAEPVEDEHIYVNIKGEVEGQQFDHICVTPQWYGDQEEYIDLSFHGNWSIPLKKDYKLRFARSEFTMNDTKDAKNYIQRIKEFLRDELNIDLLSIQN